MKKLFLIILSLFLISCTNIDSYLKEESKNILISKGINELISEEEKKELLSGNDQIAIIYQEPFRGAIAQALKFGIDNVVSFKKEIKKVASSIYENPDKIFISDNTLIIKETIKYMGKTEEGRKVLPKCRFIFLNYVSKQEIEDLSKEFGFKYSYPSLD